MTDMAVSDTRSLTSYAEFFFLLQYMPYAMTGEPETWLLNKNIETGVIFFWAKVPELYFARFCIGTKLKVGCMQF